MNCAINLHLNEGEYFEIFKKESIEFTVMF